MFTQGIMMFLVKYVTVKTLMSVFPISATMHKFSVTDDDINEAARKLKPNLTAGVDGVPSFVVKDCICCITSH